MPNGMLRCSHERATLKCLMTFIQDQQKAALCVRHPNGVERFQSDQEGHFSEPHTGGKSHSQKFRTPKRAGKSPCPDQTTVNHLGFSQPGQRDWVCEQDAPNTPHYIEGNASMTLHVLRQALLAAVNAAFDTVENANGVVEAPRISSNTPRRRAPVHPPVAPSQTPSEVDRQAAVQELNRMGVKVPR